MSGDPGSVVLIVKKTFPKEKSNFEEKYKGIRFISGIRQRNRWKLEQEVEGRRREFRKGRIFKKLYKEIRFLFRNLTGELFKNHLIARNFVWKSKTTLRRYRENREELKRVVKIEFCKNYTRKSGSYSGTWQENCLKIMSSQETLLGNRKRPWDAAGKIGKSWKNC